MLTSVATFMRTSGVLPVSVLLLAFFANGCASFSGTTGYPAYYAPPGQARELFDCRPAGKRRLWYVLFGGFSINRPAPRELFPRDDRVYRMVEKRTAFDTVASVFLALLSSVTTSTLEFQQCRVIRPSPPPVIAPEPPPEVEKAPGSTPPTIIDKIETIKEEKQTTPPAPSKPAPARPSPAASTADPPPAPSTPAPGKSP